MNVLQVVQTCADQIVVDVGVIHKLIEPRAHGVHQKHQFLVRLVLQLQTSRRYASHHHLWFGCYLTVHYVYSRYICHDECSQHLIFISSINGDMMYHLADSDRCPWISKKP